MNDNGSTILQARVRERMEALGLNPYSAARKAGLHADFVRNILRGKAKQPSAERLAKLAEALQASVPYLMGREEPDPPWAAGAAEDSSPHFSAYRPLEAWTPERGKPYPFVLPIRYELMAQAWRRASSTGKPLGWYGAERVVDPAYADREQWFEVIRDTSADLIAPPGALLQVADFSDEERPLLGEGDLVIVERSLVGPNAQYHLVERSIRQVHRRYPALGLWFLEYPTRDGEYWGTSDDLFRDDRVPHLALGHDAHLETLADLAKSIRAVEKREFTGDHAGRWVEATPDEFIERLRQSLQSKPRVVAKVLRAIIPIDSRAGFDLREADRGTSSGSRTE